MASFGIGLVILVGVCIACTNANVLSDSNLDGVGIEELVQRIVRIEAIQKSQKEELQTQKTVIEEQAREIAHLKQNCVHEVPEDLESGIGIRSGNDNPVHNKRQAAGGVSFSAYIDQDVNLGMFQTLIYDKVLINDGGGYDPSTGIFTCPRDGVYLFSFFLGEKDQHQASLRLKVNNVHVSDAIVEGYHDFQDDQGGNMVIKRLVKGDVALLQLIVGSHIEGSTALYLTTFSGVLLYT